MKPVTKTGRDIAAQRERRRLIDHAHYDALRQLRLAHPDEYDAYFEAAKRERGVSARTACTEPGSGVT